MSGEQSVAIARFIDWSEAHMARGLLETNGIACRLSDSNLVSADWGVAFAVGGIKLMVEPRDLEAARTLLRDVSDGSMGRALQRFQAIGDRDDSLAIETCPQCGGGDVFRARSPLSALITALFSAPVLLPSRTRFCRHCGARWTDGRSNSV